MRALAAACLVIASLSACGPQRVILPSGPGTPRDDYAQLYSDATQTCRTVTTLTADLALSGKAGSQRLRGHVIAGFAPNALRLEGVAPFGAPAFILAAESGRATLLLPRDHRFISSSSPREILAALVGLNLDPDDLLAALSGCVSSSRRAAAARSYGTDRAAIDLDDGSTVVVSRQSGGWIVDGGLVKGFELQYLTRKSGFPFELNMRTATGSPNVGVVDMHLRIESFTANAAIAPAAFTVEVAADMKPMSLEDLKASGPLGE